MYQFDQQSPLKMTLFYMNECLYELFYLFLKLCGHCDISMREFINIIFTFHGSICISLIIKYFQILFRCFYFGSGNQSSKDKEVDTSISCVGLHAQTASLICNFSTQRGWNRSAQQRCVGNDDPKTKTKDRRPAGLKQKTTGLKRRRIGLKIRLRKDYAHLHAS